MGEFGRDVAPADDDESFREFVDPHDCVRRVHHAVPDGLLVEPGNIGDHRASAGGQHEPIGGDVGRPAVVQIDRHRLVPGEPADARKYRDIRPFRSLAVFLAARRDFVDATEDAVPHGRPVDGIDCRMHPERTGLPGVLGNIGGVDVHLGRDASPVQTGAAKSPGLDDRNRQVLELLAQDRVARAGTDDDQVKVHCFRLTVAPRTRRAPSTGPAAAISTRTPAR